MVQPPEQRAVASAVADIVVGVATPSDVGEIWTLARAAFVDEAQRHGDPFIVALTESLEQVHAQLQTGILLKATHNSRIVGTVRGRASGTTFLVNRLAVAPDQRGRGIAGELLAELERRAREAHPRVESFALFTTQSGGPQRGLYRRLGYGEVSTERAADHVALVQMRKAVPLTV